MEEIRDEIKYSIAVPYNNTFMVADRKKQKIFAGVVFLLCALVFSFFTIISSISENSSLGVVLIFAAFTLFAIIYGLFCLCRTKANNKDESKQKVIAFIVIKDNIRKNAKKH